MKIVIDEAFSRYQTFIEHIPSMLDQRSGCEIIYDKRNLVARFCHEGETFIVKRYKRANIAQQIAYTFFRSTKAQRAYVYADEFRRRNIATPTRVAYMEDYRWGLFTTGYFVSTEAKGTESHLLLREVEQFSTDLADAVARHILLLHSNGILHGDLNLSNFLCATKPDGYHFTMIDINRSQFCKGFPTDQQCLHNMVRLTHRRDLYTYIVSSYAHLRGWNQDATVGAALRLLDKFEH